MSKYNNRKVTLPDGEVFDSQKEALRYLELKLLEKSGAICDLKRQVPFELIPAQYIEIKLASVYKRGPLKGQHKTKRYCIEQAVKYIADFVYTDLQTGKKVAEDTKGVRTKEYIIKRKLMLYVHNIRIREV